MKSNDFRPGGIGPKGQGAPAVGARGVMRKRRIERAPIMKSSEVARGSRLIRDSRGYTLVELLVVIALIALISVFSLPNISSIFKLSLNTATRELASVVKEAYN